MLLVGAEGLAGSGDAAKMPLHACKAFIKRRTASRT
jgi:hypothetical protein